MSFFITCLLALVFFILERFLIQIFKIRWLIHKLYKKEKLIDVDLKNRTIFVFFILVNIACIKAQPIENLRAIHMGGNWGLNVTGTLTHPPEYFAFLQNLNTKWVGISIALHIDDSMDSTVERKCSNSHFYRFGTFIDNSCIKTEQF